MKSVNARRGMPYEVDVCQAHQDFSHLDTWVREFKQHLLPLHGPAHRTIKMQNVLSFFFLNEQPVPKESLKGGGRL